MSFMYRSPSIRSSYTPSNTASSSSRTTPSNDASSCFNSSSPCPESYLEDDYELETEMLVAACAIQQDDHHPDDWDATKKLRFAENRMRWEDNTVYMDRDKAALDAVANAQKRSRKMDEREEKREKKRKERKSTEKREIPKFYDFMADVQSRSRAQKMPSWTHDELNLWSEETAELANTSLVMADPGMAAPPEAPITANSTALPAISEIAASIVRSITAETAPAPIQETTVAVEALPTKKPKQGLPTEPTIRTSEKPTLAGPGPTKQSRPTELSFPSSASDSPSRCAITPIIGKGLGVIATSNIIQGQAIITESPFLTVDHPPHILQVTSRLSQLPQASQDLFHTFTPTLAPHHLSRLVDIVATNVIPLGGDLIEDLDDEVVVVHADGEVEERIRSGLFETICRVNHSCAPNAQWTWFDSGRMTLRALRPIATDEEITACYLQDTSLGYDDRQKALFDAWRFICTCPVCSLPKSAREADDDRRSRYRAIRDTYINLEGQDTWHSEGLVICSKMIKKAIKLLEEGKQCEDIAHCRWSLFILSARWGDEDRAKREGSAWLKQMVKMGDVVEDQFRAHVKRPRIAPDWGLYNDDGSGEESECDTEDDFAATHSELDLVRLERTHVNINHSRRQVKRNPIRAATTAGVWA